MASKGSKRVYRPGVSGIGTFVYPKIVKPDTKGQFANGKYKTDFVLKDKKAADELFKTVVAAAKELVGEEFTEKYASGLPVKKNKAGKMIRDEDGNIVFKFSSAKKPMIVDAKRKKLPDGVDVRGGSQGRISYTLTNYDDGISLWLDAVQIVDLVAGSPGAKAFDETDGFDSSELDPEDYAFESDEEDKPPFDDAADDEADSADEGKDKFDL